MRAKKPDYFRSVQVFVRILHIFECHDIRLPFRQRVLELFDKQVLKNVVLEYNDDDESDK